MLWVGSLQVPTADVFGAGVLSGAAAFGLKVVVDRGM
jgi:hypothetical protein